MMRLWRALSCVLALTTAATGCATSPSTDAGVEDPVDAGVVHFINADANLIVNFVERPAVQADYDSGHFERTFTVSSYEPRAYPTEKMWATRLLFSEPNSEGELSFDLMKPWIVSDRTGSLLRYSYARQWTGCSSDDQSELSAEVEHVVRAADSSLLFWNVLGAATKADGIVEVDPTLVPELEVRWEDVGEPVVKTPSGGSLQTVGLRIHAVGAPTSALVRWGERVEIPGLDHSYVAMILTAQREVGGGCHSAAFSIYRADFLSNGPP